MRHSASMSLCKYLLYSSTDLEKNNPFVKCINVTPGQNELTTYGKDIP